MLIDNSLESVKPLLSEHVSLSIWQLNIFRIKVFSFWLLSVEPKMIKKKEKKNTYIPSSGGDLSKTWVRSCTLLVKPFHWLSTCLRENPTSLHTASALCNLVLPHFPRWLLCPLPRLLLFQTHYSSFRFSSRMSLLVASSTHRWEPLESLKMVWNKMWLMRMNEWMNEWTGIWEGCISFLKQEVT